MLKMNLQFFAHKKGVGSTKNGRDSESKRLGAKRAFISSAEQEFIPVLMLDVAVTIHYLHLLTEH